MTERHSGLAAFIENTGCNVCRTAGLTARGMEASAKLAAACVKRSVAPLGKDASKFLRTAVRKPVQAIGNRREKTTEKVSRFKRRSKIFGIRRAAAMQWKESALEMKRRGNTFAAAANVAFPVVSVAALIMTVNSVMSTDYGVSVQYDGENIGVVSGEDVLSEAQRVVADRVKYYDTDGDYYVTAALAITPLTSGDDVIDQEVLAEKMEGRISMKYDEKPAEAMLEAEEEEDIEGKIKAFAIRVDGELIGAVEDYSRIEEVLNEIKDPYDTGEYVEIGFNKDIQYDLEEYVDPEMLTADRLIIKTLTGVEAAPEYYEVQPGDNLWNIAESKGMTLQEISGCYATYNGKIVEDIEHSVLRVGTLIQLESEIPFLQVECKKERTVTSEIEFETITVEDPTLPEGQVVVEKEGRNGEKRSRLLVTYREGTPVRKKTLDYVITVEPVSEIIRIGTASSNSINYDVPGFITDGGSGDYFWPVDGGYISAHQGDGRGHKGIDIAAPYGTPIYAAASGTVIDVGSGWNGGYGNCIIIQNDDGNITLYAHQAETVAKLDDRVEAGQLIGYVGSTGDSSGNHLHFEIRKDGKYYDPELYVKEE